MDDTRACDANVHAHVCGYIYIYIIYIYIVCVCVCVCVCVRACVRVCVRVCRQTHGGERNGRKRRRQTTSRVHTNMQDDKKARGTSGNATKISVDVKDSVIKAPEESQKNAEDRPKQIDHTPRQAG